MAIGLLLMGGILSIFLGSKKSFDFTQEVSNIQQNARFAMDAISNDIRLAGFQGCTNIMASSAVITSNSAPTDNFFLTASRGAEVTGSVWTPAVPAELSSLSPAPVTNSDVLMLQFASPVTSRMANPMTGISDDITLVSNASGLKNGDLAIISNCLAADLFTVSTVTGTTITHSASDNISANLSAEYKPGATAAVDATRVMKFNYVTYYVGDTGRKNKAGNPIKSLYLYTMDDINSNASPTEVIEGIENMQLLFGVRASNSNIRYVTSSDGSFEPQNVASIQVGLLLHSIESATDTDDSKTYTLLNETIHRVGSPGTGPSYENDKRARMAFSSTIKVRNRIAQ
jgi:type IV pilus assembly protein PilW